MKHDALPSSPTRKVRYSACLLLPHQVTNAPKIKKVVSYAESSDEDEPFQFGGPSTSRRRSRVPRQVVKDEDDYEEPEEEEEADGGDTGMYLSCFSIRL
jgi:DNA mismatch repair protein MSH6